MIAAPRETPIVIVFIVATFASVAKAHELPTFPRITVLAARADPYRRLSWNYSVRVLDPAGRTALTDADVRITGFERRRGSDERLRAP